MSFILFDSPENYGDIIIVYKLFFLEVPLEGTI